MTEAENLKAEIDNVETWLDEIIHRASDIPHLTDNMQGSLLMLELGNQMQTRTGIAMLEALRNSAEYIMNQSFMFRNELRNYKDRL